MRDETTALEEAMSEAVSELARAGSPQKARRKKKAALLWTLWALLALVVLAGLGIGILSLRFQERFFPRTWIDKVDVSGMTIAEASAALESAGENVTLRLRDGEREIGSLPLSAVIDSGVIPAMVGDAFSQQHPDGSFFGWLRGATWLHTGQVIGYPDAAGLRDTLEAAFYHGEAPAEPVDAYIDLGQSGYTLVPEEEGNLADLELCAAAVTAAIAGESDLSPRLIEMDIPGGRILPAVTREDPELLQRCEALDSYLTAAITLDFQDGNVYTLTAEDIVSVSDIVQDGDQVRYAPDPEKVRALTDELADTLGLDGVYAKFHNVEPTRELIYYRVGDMGWRMDKQALAEDVTGAIATGQDATIFPAYDRTWYWQDYYNIDNTFVEISIDNQYMWYYVDGDLLVETPVVTGNLATGDYTRRGCFKIYGMVTDTVLTGPTWNDHVEYWMPFDGGIGLHDSSWRDEYGGDIYISDGSHGCINTPLDAIATIYENIWKGVPVVVY